MPPLIKHLLPPNATQFEKDLAETVTKIDELDVSAVSNYYNPDLCPAAQLNLLAHTLVVDHWNPNWSEPVKRAYIKQHLESRRIRGTAGSLKKALAALNMSITVIEWFQEDPQGVPGTFTVEVELDEQGITAETQNEIDSVIELHKNVRSHLDIVNIYQSVQGTHYEGGATLISETITIYPSWWEF